MGTATAIPTAVSTYPLSGTTLLDEAHRNVADVIVSRLDLGIAAFVALACVLAFAVLFLGVAQLKLGVRN